MGLPGGRRSAFEHLRADRVHGGLVAGVVGVQVVSAVVGRQELARVSGILERRVEVEDRVERAAGRDPGVDGLADLVARQGVVAGSLMVCPTEDGAGSVQSVKAVSEIYAPADGEVAAVNDPAGSSGRRGSRHSPFGKIQDIIPNERVVPRNRNRLVFRRCCTLTAVTVAALLPGLAPSLPLAQANPPWRYERAPVM
jgi:Glycine cleavage H-protein